MKITSLKLKGIGSFDREVEAPIAQLDGAAVVAVVGGNGAGKTTLLEAIPGAIYRTTPSRGALAGLANARDSFVEVGLAVGDEQLLARVMINGTAKTRPTEAYLTDGAGAALTSGKARDYDVEIERRLPPRGTYLASAFAAQTGAGRFLDLAPADRKALFAQLLGLGRLEALAAAAGEHARTAEVEVARLEAAGADARQRAAQIPALAAAETAALQALTAATDARELAEARARDAVAALERWHAAGAEVSRRADAAATALVDATHRRDRSAKALDAVDAAAVAEVAARTTAEDAAGAVAEAEAEAVTARTALDAWREGHARLVAAATVAEAEVKVSRARYDSIMADHKRDSDALARAVGRRMALEDQLAERGRLEAQAATATEAAMRVAALEVEITELRSAKERHAEALAVWREVRTKAEATYRDAVAAWTADRKAAASEARRLDSVVDGLRQQRDGLDAAFCGGVGEYAACSLIASATKAKAELPALEAALDAAERRVVEADTTPAAVAEALAADKALPPEPAPPDTTNLARVEADLVEVRKAQATANHARAKLEAMGGLRAQADGLDAEAAEIRERLRAGQDAYSLAGDEMANAEGAAANARAAVARSVAPAVPGDARLTEMRRLASAATSALARAEEQLSAATGELAEAGSDLAAYERAAREAMEAEAVASKALADHAAAKPEAPDAAELDSLRAAERAAAADHARAEQARAAAETAKAEAEASAASIAVATADLDDWRHLAQALGKNGVQALEIDAAGPEVSALCNDLFHACYGSRFSVSLETTALRANGGGTKEVFDLRVLDTEHGTDGSAGQLSGGERVMVSEALSLAICIYNSRRSGVPMEDLFRDECAGALSSENAVRYVEMLRKALDLGGFHRVYFVAHQPHLWDLADARLLVEDGTVRIADSAEIVVGARQAGDAP